MKKMIAAVALTACAMPAVSMAAVVAEIDGFGSYVSTTDDSGAPTFEPKGGGGGARARINLPMTGFFATGEYQINNMSGDTPLGKVDEDLTNARAGVGTELSLGVVSVLGRAEYVHYNIKDSFGGASAETNNDGLGVHVGADAGVGIAGVYGSVGYLRLSKTQGPEATVGVRVSFMPFLGVFGEYRYSKFNERDNSGFKGSLNDYRAGVRLSF